MSTLPSVEQEINPAIERVRREADLPFAVVKMLIDRPRRGEHLHQWLYSPAARQLHAHLTAKSIIGLLVRLCPEATEREVLDAVVNAAETAWQPRKPWPKASLPWLEEHVRSNLRGSPVVAGAVRHKPAEPRWPLPDLAAIERIAAPGPRLADLRAASPFTFDGEQRYTHWLLSKLFPPDSLLCLAMSQSEALTLPLEAWLECDLARYSFIVPSPMSSKTGLTLDGRESYRTLNNTGPRRYLVVESDFSEYAKDGKTETRYAGLIRRLRKQGITVADMCAAVLWHLAESMPLVMIVHSGGKSLHGWFPVQGLPEGVLLEFMRLAVSLGADDATWCKCQLVRLPDGTRSNGTRQAVHYFDLEDAI